MLATWWDLKMQSHGSLHRLSHLCFYSCICCFKIRGTTPYKSLSYQVYKCRGRGETPYPFLKIIKKCSGFGKKALIFSIPRLNCPNQSALILRNLPCPKQFLVVHLHIYDISNLTFVHWNCIDSICRNLGGLVVWYPKRWPGFDSQPGSILPTVNQTWIFAIYFLVEYHIRKCFQLCCIKMEFVKTNSSTFPPTFCIFYADLAIPITIPF